MRFATILVVAGLMACLTACGDDADDPPPVTNSLTAACEQLTGDDGLIEQALAAADDGPQDGTGVQGELFKIVSDGPGELSDPVGQLVDFLDDPSAYLTNGEPDSTITSAVDEIKATCS